MKFKLGLTLVILTSFLVVAGFEHASAQQGGLTITLSAEQAASINKARRFFMKVSDLLEPLASDPKLAEIRNLWRTNVFPSVIIGVRANGLTALYDVPRPDTGVKPERKVSIIIIDPELDLPRMVRERMADILADFAEPDRTKSLFWYNRPVSDEWLTAALANHLTRSMADKLTPMSKLEASEAHLAVLDRKTVKKNAGWFSTTLKSLRGTLMVHPSARYYQPTEQEITRLDALFEPPASEFEKLYRKQMYTLLLNLVRLPSQQDKLEFLLFGDTLGLTR